MKIIVLACLLSNPNVCKTISGTVSFIESHEQCSQAIRQKAKEFPDWEVKHYRCEKVEE